MESFLVATTATNLAIQFRSQPPDLPHGIVKVAGVAEKIPDLVVAA